MSDVRRTRPEDYLWAIESIATFGDDSRATTGKIAKAIGVTNGTVSSVLKDLAEKGLIDLIPYEGAILTESGRRQTHLTVRRRRLLELFFCQSLGVQWKTLEKDSFRLEPCASDRLIDYIDDFLNHPEYDAGGDPIPQADGSMPEHQILTLINAPVGKALKVIRIDLQAANSLRYLSEIGVFVDSEVLIHQISFEVSVITLETLQGRYAIGHDVARGVFVKPCH
tara:strand:- start:2014 stop:2685 length:672 start_codon:yes stop_codon:yes gene_type:complete